MNRLLEEIPSFPKVASIAPLNLGITTRVLAKKLAVEREKYKELEQNQQEAGKSSDESQRRRRSSRFLEGAAIPNSVIKGETKKPPTPIKDRASMRKERDDFVDTITNRLQPRNKMYHSIYDEDVDREVLNKIKKELQRRSLLPLNRDNEEDKKSISITSNNRSIKADPWEELKEKRRISRRTSILAPLGGERRSTYESIKKAIQNSKNIQQLLDADNIEQQKVKGVQAGNPILSSTDFKGNIVEKQTPQEKLTFEESSSYIKGFRRESGKDRKNSRRKSSLRSEKSLNLPNADRSVRIKTSSESRRFSKRSHTKLLKEELGRHSSLVVSNVLQQKKSTNT